MVTVVVILAAVTACSVSGEPVRTPDLADRATPSGAFPYGPGLPVQDPGIVADITFRPMRQKNAPADCTPAEVDRATAQIRVGPGGPAGGTLTTMVVRVTEDFDGFLEQAARCSEFALGGTVGTTVTTTVGEKSEDGGVRLERRLTMGPSTADSTPPTASVTEYVAQQGDVRLYVQNRRSGTADLGDDEATATRMLFDAARKSAFGA